MGTFAVVIHCGKLRLSTGQGPWGCQCQVDWLQMSSPILPPTVGFLTKEKQKSEDPEDGKMRTALWAEQAALLDQQTFCKLSLERAVWLCLCYGETQQLCPLVLAEKRRFSRLSNV